MRSLLIVGDSNQKFIHENVLYSELSVDKVVTGSADEESRRQAEKDFRKRADTDFLTALREQAEEEVKWSNNEYKEVVYSTFLKITVKNFYCQVATENGGDTDEEITPKKRTSSPASKKAKKN